MIATLVLLFRIHAISVNGTQLQILTLIKCAHKPNVNHNVKNSTNRSHSKTFDFTLYNNLVLQIARGNVAN